MPTAAFDTASNRCTHAPRRCRHACALLAAGALAALSLAPACAATLAEKAKESGCASKPEVVEGTMYRCVTQSGFTSYFNVPGAPPAERSAGRASATPTPAGFPKIDTATQKGRDDVRRKVLTDELSAEEKLLVEARATYADGAPVPLPEERANADKYRARISRLKQAVTVHEKNVEALKKELQTNR
ncbi:MAG: hypothetical protein ABI886_02085 [Betaproteobacteria bacterium]